MNRGARLLREWRSQQGRSQTTAARELEVSQGAYCDWETGKKTPRLEGLLRIQERAGIPPVAFTQADQPKKKRRAPLAPAAGDPKAASSPSPEDVEKTIKILHSILTKGKKKNSHKLVVREFALAALHDRFVTSWAHTSWEQMDREGLFRTAIRVMGERGEITRTSDDRLVFAEGGAAPDPPSAGKRRGTKSAPARDRRAA